MNAAKTFRRSTTLASLALFFVVAQWTAGAGAGTPIKTGKYSGKTTQAAVTPEFRNLSFTVKKGRVTLTSEPSVARDDCVSSPVFTLNGATPSKKLGRNRTFTITATSLGDKIDKIHGKFVAPNEIDGFALYHFTGQDLCSDGKSKVNFTAKHK